MLCYDILCCIMLCYVVSYYVMLSYDISCYVMLYYVMLRDVVLYYVMSCHVLLNYVTKCHAILCSNMRRDEGIIRYLTLEYFFRISNTLPPSFPFLYNLTCSPLLIHHLF